MIAALLAISLQAAAPAAAGDDERLHAIDRVWMQCRYRALDGLIHSSRSDEEVVDAAFAACRTEEEAVHAEQVRQFGQAQGDEGMAMFRRYSRGTMMGRVREVRRR